jgi:hypothetical protein
VDVSEWLAVHPFRGKDYSTTIRGVSTDAAAPEEMPHTSIDALNERRFWMVLIGVSTATDKY